MSDFIVGLTGGIGSGKTTIANLFVALGIEVIDADIVAREVVAPNSKALAAIVLRFGNDILTETNTLNRQKLREIIFNNEDEKYWLNSLLHPIIRATITQQLKQASSPYCLLVAPLLLENNLTYLVNRVLVIDVAETSQITRTIKRDNNSEQLVKSIMASQMSRQERLDKADDIIDNEQTNPDDVKAHVLALHEQYLILAKSSK